MYMHAGARVTFIIALVGFPRCTFAQSVTDQDVDAAIKSGIAALLDRISQLDEVTYHSEDNPPQTLQVRGTLIQNSGGYLRLKTPEGKTLSIPQSRVSDMLTRGHVVPEREGMLRGGPSALAALALVSGQNARDTPVLGRDSRPGTGSSPASVSRRSWWRRASARAPSSPPTSPSSKIARFMRSRGISTAGPAQASTGSSSRAQSW